MSHAYARAFSSRAALFAFLMSCTATSAFALDSASLEFGTGNRTQQWRLAAQAMTEHSWQWGTQQNVFLYWEGSVAHWQENRYQNQIERTQTLVDIGVTPVFRLQDTSRSGWYAEAAVGAHFLSDLYDNNHRTFSSRFQFGDHLALGYSSTNGWDIALKLQHFSNAGISHPNPGANFAFLKVGHRW